MVLKIEKDHQRFRQIVKGRIRDDLRKFLTRGELIGKEGKHLITIPVRGIDIPTFRYGDNNGGVGAGQGKKAETVGKRPGRPAPAAPSPASTSWRSTSPSKNWPTSSARNSSLPRIEPKGRKQHHHAPGPILAASAASAPNPSSTSSAPSARPSSARSCWATTTRPIRSSSPSKATNASEAGRKSSPRSPTRSSST